MDLKDILKILRTDWPANRLVNIVCHGHSVPAGYFKTPVVDTMSSYPHLLHVELAKRFPHAVINVIVTAIGGENSMTGARRFDEQVLVHRPDILTIDYGLNDRRSPIQKARQAWCEMIEKALAKNVKVILLTPTGDTDAKLDDPNDALNLHAEQIRELAKKYDVGLADSLAATKAVVSSGVPLGDLMSQNNHPNRLGHAIVVGELVKWFPANG